MIRVEADEATYNMHVMLRLEIEMGLMEGTMQVADLLRFGMPRCRTTRNHSEE